MIKRRKKAHIALEAGPLSDILFFLLIFFIMISTMASPSAIKVLLPKAESGQDLPTHIINVYITRAGNYYIEKSQVPFKDLKSGIAHKAKETAKPEVVLRIDKRISAEELISVIDIVNQLKIPLVVATERP